MLSVSNLSKSYGAEPILKKVSFTVSPGERLGLVGPNGSGKTTLLRILAGEEEPDEGSFRCDPPGLRIGYLPQGFAISEEETLEAFLQRMEGDVLALSTRLEALAAELAALAVGSGRAEGYDGLREIELQNEYDAVLARLELASEGMGQGPGVLAALGLAHLPLETPVGWLSGGQKTRLALAGVLLSSPQLLLLDEPTNHLDIDMLEWLEDWLTHTASSARRSGALIVSHDRAFLDRTAMSILEVDPQTYSLQSYPGNYSDYLEQKLAERERQWVAYSDQEEEIARLKRAASVVRGKAKFKRGGKGDSGDKFAKGFFADRTLETMRRAKQLERRLERLLTDERVEKPRQSWQMKLDFGDTPSSGKDVLVMEALSVGYIKEQGSGDKVRRRGAGEQGSDEKEPGRGVGDRGLEGHSELPAEELVLLSNLNLHVRQRARIAVVGQNGSGKTTLLRTIAGILPPLAGQVRLGANVRTGYMAQEQENLDPKLDAFTTLQRLAPFSETEVRSFLHLFLFSGDDVFIPVGKLSFGERARLTLAGLVASGCNLLLLDEPINHLDIPSRARFEQALAEFNGAILAVVHDRYFIQGFATEIWEVRGGEIRRWENGFSAGTRPTSTRGKK
jgi:ATPase subunit of ABC transporter with duplicated ATPase domains